MRLGYACINTVIGCSSSRTFRLSNYSNDREREAIKSNLDCLKNILKWNESRGIKFFRISSGLIPFASHPVCKLDWRDEFKNEFRIIGDFIKNHNARVTMHPGQYTLINPVNKSILSKSIKDLVYHCSVLDAMRLGSDCKIVLHLGGVYSDKESSIKRFISNYDKLPSNIKSRLVIENDEHSYSVRDCLGINAPLIVDVLHHSLNNNGEPIRSVIQKASLTWLERDGPQIIHYSDLKPGSKKGHSDSINARNFKEFLDSVKGLSFDCMLEVKDKEQSVLRLLK